MVNKCFTFICCKLLSGVAGVSSGKNESTLSSTFNFPSFTNKPIAVLVKLFESEYKVCLNAGSKGCHHASAITFPCLNNMKLCQPRPDAFAAATNWLIPADETPCDSGLVRKKACPI